MASLIAQWAENGAFFSGVLYIQASQKTCLHTEFNSSPAFHSLTPLKYRVFCYHSSKIMAKSRGHTEGPIPLSLPAAFQCKLAMQPFWTLPSLGLVAPTSLIFPQVIWLLLLSLLTWVLLPPPTIQNLPRLRPGPLPFPFHIPFKWWYQSHGLKKVIASNSPN